MMTRNEIEILAGTNSYYEFRLRQDILGLSWKLDIDPEVYSFVNWSVLKNKAIDRLVSLNGGVE